MASELDIEELNKLITGVDNYINELQKDKSILENAVDTCEQVMKNDALFKKQKPKLEDATNKLSVSIQNAAHVKEELQKVWRKIIELRDSN